MKQCVGCEQRCLCENWEMRLILKKSCEWTGIKNILPLLNFVEDLELEPLVFPDLDDDDIN